MSATLLVLICLTLEMGLPESRVLEVELRPVFGALTPPLRLNRQLQLRCDVTAQPPIEVSQTGWLYGDQAGYLTTSYKYTVHTDPPAGMADYLTSILTINGITESELGLYSCEARNSAGMYERRSLDLSRDGETGLKATDPDKETPIPVTESGIADYNIDDDANYSDSPTLTFNYTSDFYEFTDGAYDNQPGSDVTGDDENVKLGDVEGGDKRETSADTTTRSCASLAVARDSGRGRVWSWIRLGPYLLMCHVTRQSYGFG